VHFPVTTFRTKAQNQRPPIFSNPESCRKMATIKERIVSTIHHFARFVSGTSKGIRVKFPKAQAHAFCDDLGDVLNTVLGSQQMEPAELLLAFLSSIRTSIGALKGEAGIQTMCTFLNVLVNLLNQLFDRLDMIISLTERNMQLQAKLESLNAKLCRTEESEESLVSAATAEYATLDYAENPEFFTCDAEWLSGAIPIIGCADIIVLSTYSAVSRGGGDEYCLVVLYEMVTTGSCWVPPAHPNIWWQCVNNTTELAEPEGEEEEGLFTKFCREDPGTFSNLVMDFFDPSAIKLLTENSDTTCVYPSVRIAANGKYEPVLTVGVMCAKYRSLSAPVIPPRIETCSGRSVPIVLRESLMLNPCTTKITAGSGISAEGIYDQCGSVAGIVSSPSGQKYFVTCEHVIVGLEKHLPAGESALRLWIPSVLDRAVCCVQPPVLQTALSAGDSNVLLEDQLQYLHKDHVSWSCEYSSMIAFEDKKVEVVAINNQPPVEISGDIGLIPVPSRIDQLTDCSHSKVLQFKDIVHFMKRGRRIMVTLHGAGTGHPAASTNTRSLVGTFQIVNFIHIKRPSTILTDSTNMSSVLLGQYVVEGWHFGTHGDSGGLVSIEASGGRQIVGVFVGALDSTKSRFVVTPADAVTAEGFTFVGK
jgi:hypothetical protein